MTKKKIISAVLQFSYQTVNLGEQKSLLLLFHKHRKRRCMMVNFSCSPPSLSSEPQSRPNVIQNPVVRPVPTRGLPALSFASSPLRPAPLNPLTLFTDYIRRTQQLTKCGGGLWVPPSTPAPAIVASGISRAVATGQPNDLQPVLGATAGSPFGNYAGIYGSQHHEVTTYLSLY